MLEGGGAAEVREREGSPSKDWEGERRREKERKTDL